MKLRLFWNHICILHNFERGYLEKVRKTLALNGIELEIHYFGLGYPHHLSEYLMQQNALIPDLIVSADLEVFETKTLRSRLGAGLDINSILPSKQNIWAQACKREEDLLNIVAIPLCCYGSDNYEDKTLEELAQKGILSFGGINNSAGKTITKALWQKYGKETARNILAQSRVFPMPIEAFAAARKTPGLAALVPSIYALRADQTTSFSWNPGADTILLPSYLWASGRLNQSIAEQVIKEIISPELMSFYVTRGDLLACCDLCSEQSSQENLEHFIVPQPDFLNSLSDKEFYDLYCSQLPSAIRLIPEIESC